MTTKAQSALAAKLQAELVRIQAELSALTVAASAFTVEQVKKLSASHWHAIRFAMVVGGAEKPQLAKGRKGYALVKGADVKLYMACKGFENTLRSREQNGLPVELSSNLNDKGRSQIMYAQEVLEALAEAKFINPEASIFQTEPKARKSRKSA